MNPNSFSEQTNSKYGSRAKLITDPNPETYKDVGLPIDGDICDADPLGLEVKAVPL